MLSQLSYGPVGCHEKINPPDSHQVRLNRPRPAIQHARVSCFRRTTSVLLEASCELCCVAVRLNNVRLNNAPNQWAVFFVRVLRSSSFFSQAGATGPAPKCLGNCTPQAQPAAQVGARRVELRTSSLSATRSNQLSYAPPLRTSMPPNNLL